MFIDKGAAWFMGAISEQDFASGRGTARRPGLPGLAGAVVVALLSGLAAWFYGVPQIALERVAAGVGDASALAEVAPAEMPGALTTMEGGNQPLDAFRRADRDCAHRLAWVSVWRETGGQGGRIRLVSGGYASPLFDLLPTATRVAIPYPAPYRAIA